ncbi:polyribonucleotide nucleotidyltransferase [Candidatus Karelsulcia muelleri]|uniref:Polyribonucleotide nucleotidyltransferase n=1 Tax=Candidatus Karelsulcia muelleri TaxID=336810 RepID=A0A346E118_9FLAO|nr:polyribonucleotide nucleotidyltransferase [Candidatus Karelsulcia muelleri]AXN02673.1 Polyribonucleotide nucleotidyltransferase [Candidatus Karelsulcia muelleri]WDI79604.1 polyribonucleotide nucleotidyltransferase [Candidatus Karelsulcia muelleri]WDR78926.1 polyribonucleotide nucleotidyltransferase [Candidatus Karelsulcia muelleri]
MRKKLIKETIFLNDGKYITLETGQLAKQADGSILIRMGNTILLATVVISKEEKEGVNFIPLTIDYREKYSAIGKIPGGYLKREGRHTEEEIMTMRLIDRVLRPIFPKDLYKDIQILISLLSYDKRILPDVLAGLAASSALYISEIPFKKPVAIVRIIRINNSFILNPGIEQLKTSNFELIIGGSNSSILMIEGEMKEISELELLKAIKYAHKHIKSQISAQKRLRKQIKIKTNKRINSIQNKNIFNKKIIKFITKRIKKIFLNSYSKSKRSEKLENLLKQVKNKMHQCSEKISLENENEIKNSYNELKNKIILDIMFKTNKRLDGRKFNKIRDIWCKVDFLPVVHGSALFTRGETQALSTLTLGSYSDVKKIDSVIEQDKQKFYLHYNFHPFSTGEIRLVRGISRREIGHGNLAKRALKNIIPNNNPYTIRIVADVLESNGSSSMATVCASTLALMDAGIPILRPVAGLAVGLILKKSTGEKIVLSDILGEEDSLGDMDFKIAGTNLGITACQMDVKVECLNIEILAKILVKAKIGRLFILRKMLKTIPNHRQFLKPHSPKIYAFTIPKYFIGSVIGTGGKQINEIQNETNTSIFIEEKNNLGRIEIIGKKNEEIKKAGILIKSSIFFPKIGYIYKAKIKSIKDFLVFIEFSKGIESILHIYEINLKKFEILEYFLKIGDIIYVKYLGVDNKNGKMIFSNKYF